MKARIESFPTAKPEKLDVPAVAIQAMIKAIREEHKLELHSFLILRHGKLIWEEYFRENEADARHSLYSVSKSFTSTAIGLAEAQGLLSVEDKLYSFFPEHAALCDSETKDRVKLKHLLMMGSGFENNEGKIFKDRKKNPDLVLGALSQPVIHEPGTVFNYYTLGTYLLSAAFSRVNPEGIHAYLKRKLFEPMGFAKSAWSKDLLGVPMGGFGLSLTAYDMLRLGQLYLQNGAWEGQQLLPASYVQAATAKQIDNGPAASTSDWGAGYGYQFWRNTFGGFRADGMFGQYIVVLPDYDAVIVMTSHLNDMQVPLTVLREKLLPKLK